MFSMATIKHFFYAARFEGNLEKRKRKENSLPKSRKIYLEMSVDSSISEASDEMSNS